MASEVKPLPVLLACHMGSSSGPSRSPLRAWGHRRRPMWDPDEARLMPGFGLDAPSLQPSGSEARYGRFLLTLPLSPSLLPSLLPLRQSYRKGRNSVPLNKSLTKGERLRVCSGGKATQPPQGVALCPQVRLSWGQQEGAGCP